jgi:predicted nucleic acid-binding protein
MASYFFDTNALVKAYIYEPDGSDWVLGVISAKMPAHQLFVSEIARVEIPSALYKIERARDHAQEITNLAVNRFERHLDAENDYRRSLYTILLINNAVLTEAQRLLRDYRSGQPKGLRSLDALQLACALRARKTLPPEEQLQMVFVTIDKQLAGCAANEGLATFNPTHTAP